VFSLLAFRNLTLRPWRTLLLLGGYSVGVAVMIVLLSIGEALLAQARDEKLVGGGDVTVLPEGIDVEVLKTGGLGGLFFSIDNARFVHQQLLASPRLAEHVRAVAPQIEGKLLYLRTVDGNEHPVRATGEIPSLAAAVGAATPLTAGVWTDDERTRRWRSPSPAELRHAIDHFHLPPPEARGQESWAEWHYFNVLSPDRRRWAFVTLMVGGAIPDGRWGGQVLVTLHEQGKPARRFATTHESSAVRFSTEDANLAIADDHVTVLPDGRYAVRARAREENGSGASVDVDLVVSPAPRAYFPGTTLSSGEHASGYAVPALRADASGTICVRGAGARCERYDGAQSYHDHNWGVWQGVTWEWGAARAGEYTLLYGRVHPPEGTAAVQPLFVYVVDSLGFLGLFRPRGVTYEDTRTTRVGDRTIRTPSRGVMTDVRGGDTLRLELIVEDATATDTRGNIVERGETGAARRVTRPYFVQMKGLARLSGRAGGRVVRGEGAGFFETYR
jgi:hypothetical protein